MTNTDRFYLLYQAYKKEIESVLPETVMNQTQFTSMISEQFKDASFIEVEADGSYGILYYRFWEDEMAHVRVPVYGYYAESEKMMVRLFRRLADEIKSSLPMDFSVHLYGHDDACLRAMHMMQFGNIAEKCIKKISYEQMEPRHGVSIKELNKDEIARQWPEVWDTVSQIIFHLTQSPVFYKGEEFTEEVYRDFFTDPSVHVITASKGGRIIGIIEWNEEANPLISERFSSVNVGEAFVYPEFRGTGLSRQLLNFAEKQAHDNGAEYMWVEHGTANPEARGFWNKHFKTYQYELVRVVER